MRQSLQNKAGQPLRVGVLFPQTTWKSTYSLASVVRQHLETMASAGWDLRTICSEENPCPPWMPREVTYQGVLPRAFGVAPEYYEELGTPDPEQIIDLLAEHCADLDVMMTHDFINFPIYRELRSAARSVAERLPNLAWMHFMHYDTGLLFDRSIDQDSIWCEDRSYYVCLSPSHIEDTANALGVSSDRVLCLRNSRSLAQVLNISSKIAAVLDMQRIIDADVTMVHPWAIRRNMLKQPHHMLFIASILKSMGRKVYLIFADPKMGDREIYLGSKLKIKWLAHALGLDQEELVFLSADETTRPGVSAEEMSQLYRLTNVFVHASYAEGGPLAVSEAMAQNNLCILNDKVSSFHDAAGEYAIFHPFAQLEKEIGDRPHLILEWFRDNRDEYVTLVRRLIDQVDHNPIMAGRRYTFRHYMGVNANSELVAMVEWAAQNNTRPHPKMQPDDALSPQQ